MTMKDIPANVFSEHVRHFSLDRDCTYLNHGAFGACPVEVQQYQSELRSRLETQPLRFLDRELERLAAEARKVLGGLVGAAGDDIAFVTNATTGVNTVLRSLTFSPGDELLVTDHEYNACRNALEFVARRSGATVVVVRIPFPIASPEHALNSILDAVTDRTRLALVDHITSPTGLVLPIEDIVTHLNARGIDTLVDGAHAAGQVPLNLTGLGAAYYTGNCHKWLCTPKGSAYLWVRPDRQQDIRPLVISHGANARTRGQSRFRMEFDWQGTFDPTPWLCIPRAVELLSSLFDGGMEGLMRRNHEVVMQGRAVLCEALGIAEPCPESMIGSLAAVPLPPGVGDGPLDDHFRDATALALSAGYGIEVPVFAWPAWPRRVLRISAQVYNDPQQYRRLAAALVRILEDSP